MHSLLIRNAAAILTGLPGDAARHAGPDLRIRGTRVEAIGALAPEPGEAQIDAAGCVIYPAWVNTHHHLAESLLKGLPAGINASLTDWLHAVPIRYRGRYSEKSFRAAARIGLVELALSGCGTVADHNFVYYPDADFDSSAILFEEAEALGLRFVLCRAGATRSRITPADARDRWRPESFDSFLKHIERTVKRFHDPASDAMRRVVMGPTTPLFDFDPGELRECARVARAWGLRLHTHLSETVAYKEVAQERYGMSPVAFMEQHEWLGSDVWLAHLVKLDADEIAALGASNTGIAHCPQSNARLGSGIAKLPELEAAGVSISIGVDGAGSNEAADMISEVHAAWLLQRARIGEAALPRYQGGQFEGGAHAATVEDVVRWGTAGGARVLGFEGLGELAPGRPADLAIYRLDAPRYFGLNDVAIGPVVSGGRPHLRALLVGGRMVVENDALPGFDLAQLAAQAKEAMRELMA
ncbi:MAG: amidohydrolase [Betaproteobacteria bacterium]|nr:amidohydrolase [Betaproteobacteria bacterium]